MNVSRQIQKSKTEYKEKQKIEQIQKENSGEYECVVINSEASDGELHLTLQSEFGEHNISFDICDNNRKSGKSLVIENLENKTQGNVEYPESFIGKEAIIKNSYKTQKSFIIFESNKEKYISKLWINIVNKNGEHDNKNILETHHFLSCIVFFIGLVGGGIILDTLFSFVIPLFMIIPSTMFLCSYLALVTILHEIYEPIVKKVDYVNKNKLSNF